MPVKAFFRVSLCLFLLSQASNPLFAQLRYNISGKDIVITSAGRKYLFSGQFAIIYSATKPDLALRSAGIKGVPYNVPTWKAMEAGKADLKESKIGNDMVGDGFDDKILKGNQKNRTANLYNPGELVLAEPSKIINKKDSIVFEYPATALFDLSAVIVFNKSAYPVLKFTLTPKQKGYFSIGYTGAPAMDPAAAAEIWQPLVWQEKRFPDNSYLTPAYMATLPTTLVNDGRNSIGVLASPEHLPFDPLPVFANSQFGISVRDKDGMAKPQVFAPVFGSSKSLMKSSQAFSFSAYLVVEPASISYTYEKIARDYFGFKDYRKNDISTLNSAFENIVDYSLTNYASFVDSLKGFAYSTDVPGAVKNVSSLNPIELAIVTDHKEVFDNRAYPLMEYMLSREKFLFALDSTQKIQIPSRKLNGPIAPISELAALYNVFGNVNPFYLSLAKQEYDTQRIRNLHVPEKGDTWITAMNLYKANKQSVYLKRAIAGANAYLKARVMRKQSAFDDEFAGEFFFWPSFTNKWIDLLELFELTGDKKYLKAAHEGARYYAMFTWMAPLIPADSLITVNKGGKAPHYGYLKSKGHKQMNFPEEKAPAWRLSEIGLTPESSGTSTGHRAIFMANYAPWMLRLGYYTKDNFLKEIAKAAIIGRYRNFPGYHINTGRTTAYEKADFPMNAHKDQSVSSFHYNHIMPMASMLLDYLVTDAFVRSEGKVHFPSQFIEGYAYLQNKFYGVAKGRFYEENGIRLWMPKQLLTTDNIELNYISGRRGNEVFIAFMNQSNQALSSMVNFNEALIKGAKGSNKFIYEGKGWKEAGIGDLNINVAAGGITVVRLKNVDPQVHIQEEILASAGPLKNDYAKIEFGRAEAMLIRMGNYGTRAYVYLKDDDTFYTEVSLHYQLSDGRTQTIVRKEYPFEFTVALPSDKPYISFNLEGLKKNGQKVCSETTNLGDAD